MGARGTDVAREAADVVLLDDDFSSITQAIRLGRRIYDNIAKATAYVLAIHVPIAGLALVPVVLGWPLVLLPVHIVFLELIIDPASSIAFEAEPEERDVMDRPPRDPNTSLLDRRGIVGASLQGVLALMLVCVVLGFAVHRGYDEERSRAITFSTLIVANVGLILANRSASANVLAVLAGRNPALWSVVGGAIAVLGLAFLVPALRGVFRFGVPAWSDLALVVALGAAGLLGFELLKAPPRRGRARGASAIFVAALLAPGAHHRVHAADDAGARLYRQYCAACHGERGRGDGPAGAALCPAPTDLTKLRSDVPDLMRQIDGRRAIRAHGSGEMPVWGEVFEQSLLDEPHRRRTALLKVRTLAEYVRGLRIP
jgi:mono/diheme cytochrome c family protein